MKRSFIAVALACVVGLTTMTNADAKIVRVKRCHARGDYATCVAAGNVEHPRALYVKVASRPSQGFKAYWSVVCSKGYGAGSKSGHFSGRTPKKVRIKMPYVRPDSCSVSADAQLGDGGYLKVVISARV